jgi:hypothetical protein
MPGYPDLLDVLRITMKPAETPPGAGPAVIGARREGPRAGPVTALRPQHPPGIATGRRARLMHEDLPRRSLHH